MPDESAPSAKAALAREMLERVADKWTLHAIDVLEEGPLRFREVQRRIGGITQKVLTKTLRQMERDGLVTRHVYPEVPPRVEYRLTKLGESLGETTCQLWRWAERHAGAVQRARRAFDARAR